jgi:hypothetical protein
MPRTGLSHRSAHGRRSAPAGDRRRTTLRYGAREILQHLHVPVMGEGHRVGAAAGVAVAPWVSVRPSRQWTCSTPSARCRLAFSKCSVMLSDLPGKLAVEAVSQPSAPLAKRRPDDGHVLRLHVVQSAGARHRLHGRHRPGQRQRQVDRVNGLRDQDAAAVARIGAAPGLVVIGLFPPPGHGNLGKPQRAETCRPAPARARPATPPACGAETRRPTARQPLADRHDLLGLRKGAAHGFFQEDRLSRLKPAVRSGTARASGGVRTRRCPRAVSAQIAERCRKHRHVVHSGFRSLAANAGRAVRHACDMTPARRSGNLASRIASRWVRATMPVPIIAIPRGLRPACHWPPLPDSIGAHARIVRSFPLGYSGGNRAERQDRADFILRLSRRPM